MGGMDGSRKGVRMEKIEGWERVRMEKIGMERSMDGKDERREGVRMEKIGEGKV